MTVKPICPNCGSIDVALANKRGTCCEQDCGHSGTSASFKNNKHHIGPSRPGNTKWRDPIALTPESYDGE